MEKNKSELLINVRNAYRLLFEYQTKVQSLVKFISGKFGFTYVGGFPKFSRNQPRQGSGNLDLWAWDWLNMYFHEFHFGTNELPNRSDKITFSLFILNDDGYFQACQNQQRNVGRVNPNRFESSNLSNTKLIFVVGFNCWSFKAPFANNNWCNQQISLEEKGYFEDENGKMFYKSYDLELFFEEKDTLKQIDDFVIECNAIGIPLQQVEMKIGNNKK